MFQTIMVEVSMSNVGRVRLMAWFVSHSCIGRPGRLRSGQWRCLSHAKVGKDKDEGFS